MLKDFYNLSIMYCELSALLPGSPKFIHQTHPGKILKMVVDALLRLRMSVKFIKCLGCPGGGLLQCAVDSTR